MSQREEVFTIAAFIATIAMHFPIPKLNDDAQVEGFILSIERMIGHFGPQVLKAAADSILRNRDRKRDGAFFPTPKDCIDACERAKRAIEAKSAPMLEVAKRPVEWSRERHELALDLLRTPMGELASAEGWHGSLYDFAYSRARLPNPSEVGEVKRIAAEFEAAKKACEEGRVSWGARDLARLGQNIARRRDRIVAAVTGGTDDNRR